jgi:hypothetical protein
MSMLYKKQTRFSLICLLAGGLMFISCQKELDLESSSSGVVTTVKMKPKVGTRWSYTYYSYYPSGGLITSYAVGHQAKSEETLGGETWLNIVDTSTQATVYYLNEKTGGLYQYAGSASNLFCKSPATVNETYSSFGGSEIFKVKGVNDTIPTGIGDIPANYYEGSNLGGIVIDNIWYNEYAWIVRRYFYTIPLFTPAYKSSALFLQKIEY